VGTQTQLIQDTINNVGKLIVDQGKIISDNVKLLFDQQILKTPFAGAFGVTNNTLVSDQLALGLDNLSRTFDLQGFLFDLNVLVGNGTVQPPTTTPPTPTPTPTPTRTNDPDNDQDIDMY
jgi:hypothetical protein